MTGSTHSRRTAGVLLMFLIFTWAAFVPGVAAQGGGPTLVQTAEIALGLDCSAASALDPAGETLWILMNDCGYRRYSLRAYRLPDGTQVETDDWSDALTNLDGVYLDGFITPMGFTPAGDLSIRYNDPDTYASLNLVIPLASGGEAEVRSSASYDALLAALSPYPDFSVYSPDHTLVAAADGSAYHVVDVQAEREIGAVPVEGGTDYTYALFTIDNQRLLVVSLANPDDMSDFSSIVSVYSVPDGALLAEYSLPAPLISISPDQTLAAVNVITNQVEQLNELMIVDLVSGQLSAASNLLEAPRPVPTCLNDGRDVSELGFMTRGYFALTGLHWLPDGGGAAVTLSYEGDGAADHIGRICIFNTSRLRLYSVGG